MNPNGREDAIGGHSIPENPRCLPVHINFGGVHEMFELNFPTLHEGPSVGEGGGLPRRIRQDTCLT